MNATLAVVVETSTTGLCPLTVTDSSTAPSFSDEIDARVEADGQPQVFANRRREPAELGLEPIGAGRQVDELIVSGRIGHLVELPDQQRGAGDGDRHARQHGVGLVLDRAFDGAG